ncbi:MAG: TVP38/TMEM64 family protein [Acaryochloris sp. CRU_2_0]|nr:TVP38/TMEM64 family protein [Acaryochloris sp. CRU_2_0]
MPLKRVVQLFRKPQFWLLAALATTLAIAFHRFNLQAVLHTCWLWFSGFVTQNPLVFILFFNIATLLCFPASLLALKAGYVFGLGWGTVYVLVAAILGTILAFLMGRYLTRHWVQPKLQDNFRFRAITHAVEKEGWKIVLLTRLSPIFPFNLTNVAFGMTQISLKNYSLGSFGILPGTVLYTYMGSLSSELTTMDLSASSMPLSLKIAQWGLRFVGLAATLVITLYLNRIAKKVLNQRLISESSAHASKMIP